MHISEMIDTMKAPVFIARTSCNTPANVIKTKNAITKAFRNQKEGRGYSIVEIITSCPTNWGLDPIDSLEFLQDKMLEEFPLGVIRDR